MYERKILKMVYVLSCKGMNERSIKQELKHRYDIIITCLQIQDIIHRNHIVKKDRREKYNYILRRIILKMYQEFYDTEKICIYINKRYGLQLTVTKLTQFAFKHNVHKHISKHCISGKTSYLQQKQIVNDYTHNRLTTKQLMEKYGYRTSKSITDKVKRYGKIRTSVETKQLNKTYNGISLSILDSEWKAYYMGLLVTDGWISKKRVFLDLIDYDVMSMLSKIINVNLTTRKRPNQQKSYRFSITYHNILDDVKRYGLVECKTHILQPPNLYESEMIFLKDFIRGVIDGDGWISKDGKEFFISSASYDFIIWCKDILEKKFNMQNLNIVIHNQFYLLRSHKQCNISVLKNSIYMHPFGMQRKYQRLYNS